MNYLNDCEMRDLEKPTTSKAVPKQTLTSAINTDKDGSTDDEDQEQKVESTLWSIEDDTMFFAQGLKNHSGGKQKSVFATWNENYLLNFVFKTSSKTRKTTMTKVRLSMPWRDKIKKEKEEIKDMLILEMNTLLLMRSGNVYYFSSAKSIHSVAWLEQVRCISACPLTQFSIIRFQNSCEKTKMPKQLLLEVYQDIAQLGKCPQRKEALRHSYDISFDFRNVFKCDWSDECYVLKSFITNEQNIDFLQKLLATATFLDAKEECKQIELSQEVHIFTVSGNMFMLVGATMYDQNVSAADANVEDYSISLLNSYASNIECIQIDFDKNLLIVLLKSGHMDIWYKSQRMLGAIQHLNHEILYFTHYDYNPCDNTFYITTPEEVTQLQVIQRNDSLCECQIHVEHKAIPGIIACTWVDSLQQLVCLSYNNIFYRLYFPRKTNTEEDIKEINVKFENYQELYALTKRKIKDVLNKSQIVNDLIKLPEQLHHDIEMEYQKQQLMALINKRKLWQRLFNSHLEYHKAIPAELYHSQDIVLIRSSFDDMQPEQEESSMYALIYLSLNKKNFGFINIMQASLWYIEIVSLTKWQRENLLLNIPVEILKKSICFVIRYSTNSMLPDFTLSLRSFIQHCSQYVCINIDIDVQHNEKSYRHLFNQGAQQLNLFELHHLNPNYLITNFKQKHLKQSIKQNAKTQVKQVVKVPISDLKNTLEVLNVKYVVSQTGENVELYFCNIHPLHLSYEADKQLLTIITENLEALMYFKIFLMHQLNSGDISCKMDLTTTQEGQLKIMQLQGEVERIYGTLLSSTEYMEVDSGTISLHLENLHKVYLKLRSEFTDIFR